MMKRFHPTAHHKSTTHEFERCITLPIAKKRIETWVKQNKAEWLQDWEILNFLGDDEYYRRYRIDNQAGVAIITIGD